MQLALEDDDRILIYKKDGGYISQITIDDLECNLAEKELDHMILLDY